jgi:DNA-binding FrmR family transcriptional regulator
MEKTVISLLNNVIGQLNGVKKMIEEEKDCISVIPQIKAAKSALSSLLDKYVVSNADFCVSDLEKNKKGELLKLIKELSK